MAPFRRRHLPWSQRIALTWLLQAILFLALFVALPQVVIVDLRRAILLAVTVGLAAALVRPLLVWLSIRPSLLILATLSLLASAGSVWLAASVPGVVIEGNWVPVFIVFTLALVNIGFGQMLAIDDDDAYFHHLLQPIIKLNSDRKPCGTPGVIFLEIDGLAEPILRRAMAGGHMPTLARWLSSGGHRLAKWECDLSSQSSASQAGILLGDNFDIPAFRWYEKEHKQLMVSNHPADLLEMERRLSRGRGLLADGGTSRSNLFSGDAPRTIFTFSTVSDGARHSCQDFYPLLMAPYNILRTGLLFIWEVLLELRSARYQRRHDIRPRVHRGGINALVRAATTIVLRELSLYVLIGDILAGVPSAYTTFFGYDEVAHHCGIERTDAIDVLRKLDQQLDRLERTVALAPRPYQFVVLSDHGQSQGATFSQRHGMTLEELVRRLTGNKHTVESLQFKDGGWGKADVVLTDLLNDVIPGRHGIISRLVRRGLRRFTIDPEERSSPGSGCLEESGRRRVRVNLRPPPLSQEEGGASAPDPAEIVVLASGNLGLIYFTDWQDRLSYEQINEAFPGLIGDLAGHNGIGFLLVHSARHGPLAIGSEGTHFLRDGRIEGADPLSRFSAHAAAHLRRTDSFPHAADIMLNGFYDPETGEVAAFEELVGSHGGLGGTQTEAFVMYPSEWVGEDEPIIGAAGLHTQLKRWLANMEQS